MKGKASYAIKKRGVSIAICISVIAILSCSDSDNESSQNNIKPANITFWNESSYRVDLYKNLNPVHFDPTTLVCTINAGSTAKVTMYPSMDQMIGDTFYPRYKVLLANSFYTGTTDIHIDAQRNLSNISFVVESGKSYTKTISQPQSGELVFNNGYIAIQNTTTSPVQIINATEILLKLDNKGVYINPGQHLGYYEITIPWHVDTLNINQLKAFSSSDINFPAFEMERGKLYRFTVSNTGVTGPTVTPINPVP